MNKSTNQSVDELMNKLCLYTGLQPNKTGKKLVQIPLHEVAQAN